MGNDGKKKTEIEDDIQEENIYRNVTKDENDLSNNTSDNEANIENNTPNTSINSEVYQYKEKEYKTNSLQEHTKVTKASMASRAILFGFYALVIVIGAIAVLMIRANKYEFYLKEDEVIINVGSSYQVELIPKDARYFDYLKYDYSIADESIATVDEYGTVTTKKAGKTTLKIGLRPGFSSKVVQIVSSSIDIDSLDIGVIDKDELKPVNDLTLGVDHSVTIKAIVNNETDVNVTADFASSDKSVAIVDEFGNVTAVGVGETTIRGELDGVTTTIGVVVTEETLSKSAPKETKKIYSLDLGVGDKISKYVGDSLELNPTTEPANVKGSTIEWKSSDSKVVTVSKGIIKCVSVGRATITAEINGTKASVIVVVENKPAKTEGKIQKIDLGVDSKISKYVDDSLRLYPKLEPSNIKADIKWTSSDSKVATVKDGLIKCIKAGKTTITAEVNGVKSSVEVTVKNKERIKVSKITFTSGSKATAYVGDKLNVIASVEPKNATGYTIKWTSSDSKVATIKDGKISCEKAGKTTITAEADGAKASFTLTVNKADARVKVKEISLGVAGEVTKYVGETLQISPKVKPSDATGYTVKWTSSDESKATVKNGLVKCVKKGTPTITAEIDGVKSSVKFICKDKESQVVKGEQFKISQIKLSKTELTIDKNKTAKFTITVSKASATIKVTSSDNSVATVAMPSGDICDNNVCFFDGMQKNDSLEFVVTGKKAGTAYINLDGIEIYNTINITEMKGNGKVGILVK